MMAGMRCLVWLLLVLGLACGVGDGRAAVGTFLGGTSVQEFATTVTPASDGWRYAGYDRYAAYGARVQEASAGGAPADRFRANSKEEDPTGLLNEGFRYRDLETGTFISRDPLGFVDGPNVYCYVGQNPWSAFDPEGLQEAAHWAPALSLFAQFWEFFLGGSHSVAQNTITPGVGQGGVVRGVVDTATFRLTASSDKSRESLSSLAGMDVGGSLVPVANTLLMARSGETAGGHYATSEMVVDSAINDLFALAPLGRTIVNKSLSSSGRFSIPQPLEIPGAGTVGAVNKPLMASGGTWTGNTGGAGLTFNIKPAAKTTAPAQQLVDLTDFRSTHILNRHRAGAGISGKTEFPASWSDQQTLHHISDVATDPAAVTGMGKWNSPYSIGVRDGVEIRVDFYPTTHPTHAGKISTAYPTNVPPNP